MFCFVSCIIDRSSFCVRLLFCSFFLSFDDKLGTTHPVSRWKWCAMVEKFVFIIGINDKSNLLIGIERGIWRRNVQISVVVDFDQSITSFSSTDRNSPANGSLHSCESLLIETWSLSKDFTFPLWQRTRRKDFRSTKIDVSSIDQSGITDKTSSISARRISNVFLRLDVAHDIDPCWSPSLSRSGPRSMPDDRWEMKDLDLIKARIDPLPLSFSSDLIIRWRGTRSICSFAHHHKNRITSKCLALYGE